mmetsp:Transcript_6891/g.21692  ORF Transcript_6891/g.21692 Transcript_6891/m.21692 type:complete len:130 (+) Transcript_6891:597-986(+)
MFLGIVGKNMLHVFLSFEELTASGASRISAFDEAFSCFKVGMLSTHQLVSAGSADVFTGWGSADVFERSTTHFGARFVLARTRGDIVLPLMNVGQGAGYSMTVHFAWCHVSDSGLQVLNGRSLAGHVRS